MKKVINTKNAVLAALMIVSLTGNYSFAGPGFIKSIRAGDKPLQVVARSGDFQRVQELVEVGRVNVNEQNLKGETALMLAFDLDVLKKREVQWNIVKYLIDSGANVNLKDNKGNTILHRILSREAKYDRNRNLKIMPFSYECVTYLLMAGADVKATNNENEDVIGAFIRGNGNLNKNLEKNAIITLQRDMYVLLKYCGAIPERDFIINEALHEYVQHLGELFKIEKKCRVGVWDNQDPYGSFIAISWFLKKIIDNEDNLDKPEQRLKVFKRNRNQNLVKNDIDNQEIEF